MLTILRAFLGSLVFLVAMALSGNVFAQDTEDEISDTDWVFGGAIYAWGAHIDAVTARGGESSLPFYNILDNLQMTFMGAFSARKGKWSVVTDVIYLDLKHKESSQPSGPNGGNVTVNKSVELKSWVVSPTLRYAIYDSGKMEVDLLGGLRYLYLDSVAEVYFNQAQVVDLNASGRNWDFVVGARARFAINDKWFIPAYVDVGTGDSDSTFQAMAGIGYQFKRVNMVLTYRYLNYNLEDDGPVLSKLTMKGPMAGVTFRF